MSAIQNFYSSCRMAFDFGDYDALGVGEYLKEVVEERQSQVGKKEKPKRNRRNKSKRVEIVGEDYLGDNDVRDVVEYYCESRVSSSALGVVENIIPNELKNIGAARYNNDCLEYFYKDEFRNGNELDGELEETNSVVTSTPKTSINTSSPPKASRKNRKSKNALLQGLEKLKLNSSETPDKKCESNILSPATNNETNGFSSEECSSTTDDSSYLTAISSEFSSDSSTPLTGSSIKKHHSTSKRLSNLMRPVTTPKKGNTTTKKPTQKESPKRYVAALHSDDFNYNASDFPALSRKSC